MKKKKNSAEPYRLIEERKKVSAESVLKWLEEACQFVRIFLSAEDIEKWRRAKADPAYTDPLPQLK